MKRKQKSYRRPKQLFDAERIQEENRLKARYGLKNKREIWKTLAKINYYRSRVKALAKASKEEREAFLKKLQSIGLNTQSTADVLDLKVENLLERRLPTIVAKQKLAPTVKTARQMVVHKLITINGNVVNAPSYIVSVSQEKTIAVKKSKKPKATPVEEKPAEAGSSPEAELPEEKKEAQERKEDPQ